MATISGLEILVFQNGISAISAVVLFLIGILTINFIKKKKSAKVKSKKTKSRKR